MNAKIIPWATVGLVAGFVVGLVIGANVKRGVSGAVTTETQGTDLVVRVSGKKLAASALGL